MPDRASVALARLTTPHEADEQEAFFAWCALAASRIPELAECYSVPNAGGLKGGFRSNRALVAAMKRQGVKPGVPDVQLDVARGPYHGWRCEMKRRDPRLSATSPEQLAWHARLRARGYDVEVCYGWEQARRAVLAYLGLPNTEPLTED